MPVTSIFSFSHNVLYHIKNFAILATFKLLSANVLNLDMYYILMYGKELLL